MKRQLTLEEINDLCSVIQPMCRLDEGVNNVVTENIKIGLVKQLEAIQIYPEAIPKLKETIHHYYVFSSIQPGEMVGCIAASSIGEQNTQASLNSVDWNTRVLIHVNGKCVENHIGHIIDEEMRQNPNVKTLHYSGKNDTENVPWCKVLDIPQNETNKGWKIETVDEDGKMSWKRITRLICHPLYTGLIRVKTESGRNVVATTGLSFLLKRDDKIVQVEGSELKVGDKLPISWRINNEDEKLSIDIKEYLSPTKYIYGSELFKARRYREFYKQAGQVEFNWWREHYLKDFTIPFKRADIVVQTLETEQLQEGFIYMKDRKTGNMCSERIPETVPLDEEFGFFLGIYLSTGCCTYNEVNIAVYESDIIERTKRFMDGWNLRYDTFASDMTDIRMYSKILSEFLKKTCGDGLGERFLPSFVYQSNTTFIKGLLNGLIDGCGCIISQTKEITFATDSEHLIDGLMTLLTRLHIFSSKIVYTEHYTLCVSDIHYMHLLLFLKDGIIQRSNISVYTNKDRFNDVMMDTIVSIEEVEPSHSLVYDFSVEETKNFCILGGLNMADSFHSSGIGKANLTTGIVRLNELLNCSKTMKTPSCSIYLNKDMLNTSDLQNVYEFAEERIKYNSLGMLIRQVEMLYKPELTEYENEYYSHYSDLFTIKRTDWCVRIHLHKTKLFRCKKDIFHIVSCIHACIDTQFECSIVGYPNEDLKIDIWVHTDVVPIDDILNALRKKKNITKDSKIEEVLSHLINEENQSKMYIKNIVLPSLENIPISGIFGIEECYFEEEKDEWFINTKGSNYKELIKQPYVDFRRTKSNNMWDMCDTLGIEGTTAFLIEEFEKGIKVNRRHLDLLINMMTNCGKIKSVSRYGIDRKEVGPLAKACFEQPIENFLISATKGETDTLSSITSTICMGKLSRLGTGMVDLITDVKKLQPNVYGGGFYNKRTTKQNLDDIRRQEIRKWKKPIVVSKQKPKLIRFDIEDDDDVGVF